nr:hypothetical protein RTCK_00209 [Rhizobium sp. TCK]
MKRAADNARLYAVTAAVFAVGTVAFWLFAPIDKTAVPYRNKLENGCYMLFGSAVIDEPGCFELQEDVVFDGDDDYFLVIRSSDVRIDLKGNMVTGPGQSSTQSGIYIDGGDNIDISNGSLGGFMFGIRGETSAAGETLEGVKLRKLNITNASLVGVKLIADDVSIENIHVETPQGAENRKYDYVLDIDVEALSCSYRGSQQNSSSDHDRNEPLVRLPENCRIAR